MEKEIRSAAFHWIKSQFDIYDGAVPRNVLEKGFNFKGQRITVIGPAGIWKPKQFESIPISITSTPAGPYDDSFTDDGLLVYRYRGVNPNHRDNIGLREAMMTQTPLIYFHGIVKGRYLPIWPVFIINDNPADLSCLVAIDPAYTLDSKSALSSSLTGTDSSESLLGV
ncbi:MAG: hypothetical protein JW943_07505 [Deltaproteobacteria bacterium]|nr:hypothetical protein [Deltaproteobacteria bacterium]